MPTLIYCIGVVVVAGIVAYLISWAPIVQEPFKRIAVWLIAVVAVLVILSRLWPIFVARTG